MPYSYVQYTGNGSTTNYAFSFPYLDASHIKVRVNGNQTNFTFLNSSTVSITPAPAVGAIIDIRRETPKDSPPVDFTDGSVLLESDLDELARFSLYTAQESTDGVQDSMTKNTLGIWDGQNRIIRGVANPVENSDAVNKGFLGYEYPKVATVADNIANVNNVGPNIASVNAVAGSLAQVQNVSSNISNVNKVANVDDEVRDVSAIDDKVVIVANNVTPVNTVANSIANVNATGGSIGNVNTAAANIANVNTVATNIANVNAAGSNINSVNQVASIIADVVTVAQNKVDVETLADEINKVITVANDLNEAVSEIDVVANNIAKVETVANNIAAVNSAQANASTATTKAAEAAASAASALNSANLADADRIAAEAAALRAEGAADATTTNTVIPTQNITGNGGTTYTINRSVSYAGSILVEVAGVTQTPIDAYNVVAGNQLVFTGNVPNGALISVRWLDKESQTGAALALEWASKARNQFVTGSSEYSSKHHALVAADNNSESNSHKLKAEEWASKPRNTNVSGTSEYSAKHYALEAKDSATAADESEAFALSCRNSALQYRNEAQAFAAAAGGAANSVPVVFTGNGSQTAFALTTAAQNVQSIVVTVNTVLQDMFNAYTLTNAGATLNFDQAPPNGARIVVRYL